MKRILFLIIILSSLFFIPRPVLARVTPEDIINSQKEDYQIKVKNYSPYHQQKLVEFTSIITQINKKRTDQLTQAIEKQAEVLDQYQLAALTKDGENIETARYWLTFAHEAVAYQAAKIYIFNLSSEKQIKNNVSATINLLNSDLNSTKKKVLYSQKLIKELIK